jgi:hypothetical protein
LAYIIKLDIVQSLASSPSFCNCRIPVEKLETKYRSYDTRMVVCGMNFENARSSGGRYGRPEKQARAQSPMICHLFQYPFLRLTFKMGIFTITEAPV